VAKHDRTRSSSKPKSETVEPDEETPDEESTETTEEEDAEHEHDETVTPSEEDDTTTEAPADREIETLPVGTLDVDIADLDKKPQAGEVGPVILAGFWVRLGPSKTNDERYDGAIAQIVQSPWSPAPIGVPDSGIAGYIYDEENEDFIVQTRDTAQALLTVPQSEITEWAQARVDLAPYG